MSFKAEIGHNSKLNTWLVNGIVGLVLVFSVTGCNRPNAATFGSTTPPAGSLPEGTAQTSYADVVSRVAPSVVTIRADRRVRNPQQFPFADDPFFRDFFGNRRPQQQDPRESLQRALGSAVIVSTDGYMLTNHHVVDGAENIRVELNDGRTLEAKIVGSDPPSDLAVLRVTGNNLPTLTLGDSDRVRVGDIALAIGNPLNVGQTVTMGIISAKGRATGLSNGSFEDFIQTDAPINQGNSGGALINTNGELIGINSQILSASGGSIGLGFAIPSNMARTVMDQLIKSGKVRRGQLGIGVQRVTSDLAAAMGLSEAKGVIVGSVRPGSAAERAGIRRGDVITEIDGSPVSDTNSFRNRVASTAPDTAVTLTVMREGREQKIRSTLGEFTPDANSRDSERSEGGNSPSTGKLGIGVEPLTPETAARLGLSAGSQGLVIQQLDPAGPAAEAGLQQGDVIEEVNRQPVRSAADLSAALARTGTRPALLLINRRGNTIFITVKPRS